MIRILTVLYEFVSIRKRILNLSRRRYADRRPQPGALPLPLDFANIVPENNLRLPDALTIKHGPAPLLARFILEGDKAAREVGLRLRIRHDFEELLFVNRQNARAGWYPLVDAFNPEYVNLTPENAFWISGENDAGEIVTTRITRIYDWTGTNLEEQARAFWYGKDEAQPCVVTAPAAKLISGVVAGGGAFWVRPDYRGKHLSHWIPRIGKALACARWPIEWLFCYISRDQVNKGLAVNYGQKHLSHSVFYPGSTHGEIVLAYTASDEFYDDIATVLAARSASRRENGMSLAPNLRVHPVTKISSDEVFQGSMSRS